MPRKIDPELVAAITDHWWDADTEAYKNAHCTERHPDGSLCVPKRFLAADNKSYVYVCIDRALREIM